MFMRNEPEAQRQRSILERNSASITPGSSILRYSSLGLTPAATDCASISLPSDRATPAARLPFTRTEITSAPVVISTPRERASFAIASLIAPIPPTA